MRARALVACGAAFLLLGAACTSKGLPTPSTPGSGASGLAGSAAANPLCEQPPSPSPEPSGSGTLPPAIAKVANQVEQVRGLKFTRQVVPEQVTAARMTSILRDMVNTGSPPDMDARRGKAWIAMGAIPAGSNLHQEIVDLLSTQVIGFYDPDTKRLVFISAPSPNPYQRFTLSHELTHALQDQNFGLGRLEALNKKCQDEQAEAYLSLVEGDAVETQIEWAQRFLSSTEIQQLQDEESSFPPPPSSVPTFVYNSFVFPYPNGQAFLDALEARGGEQAVNDAFRNPPVSTEQILHPEKYPSDAPQAVQVPDVVSKLGAGWKDLDLEDVGEGWLRLYLEVRLPDGDAEKAAAGWDGGQYRAWSNGSSTAVLLETVWDSAGDAGEFATAMKRFGNGHPVEVVQSGTAVHVAFGSDQTALALLQRASS